jgi:hypothetical protein
MGDLNLRKVPDKILTAFLGENFMTTKADYTDAEWKTLLMAPLSCGFAVAMSDFGLVSTAIEGAAMNKELSEATTTYANNELIKTLFHKADGSEPVKIDPAELGTDANNAVEKATTYINEAIKILSAKSPTELADYKALCYGVADRVANAAGSGLFGSGAKVSDKEAAALAKLKATLG